MRFKTLYNKEVYMGLLLLLVGILILAVTIYVLLTGHHILIFGLFVLPLVSGLNIGLGITSLKNYIKKAQGVT